MVLNKRFKRLLASSLAVGLISSQLSMPAFAHSDSKHDHGKKRHHKERLYNLSLMHTNDTHAHLDSAPKLVTAVKEARIENPNALLLSAGDVFSGTLYFNEFQGQADLEFMNLLDYDLMTFGNHEFDLGASPDGHKALAEFVKNAEFPFVSSNVNFSQDPLLKDLFKGYAMRTKDGNIYSTVVKKVNGQYIGFIGLTTEETKDISSPENVTFKDYIESAEKEIKRLEHFGINKIVALTHLGLDDSADYDNDLELAKNVDGIDVIVGGHSHTQIDEPIVVDKDENGQEKDPTIIVQASQYGDYLGTLDVKFNRKGEVIEHSGELISVDEKADDPKAAQILKKYSDKIEEVKNRPTSGTAEKALDNPRLGEGDATSVRANETELGNLITDGMLDKAREFNPNVAMAFQNGGGIRAPIDAGEITYGDVLTTLPFGNTLATMKLTGAEIKSALEHSVKDAPKEHGGFLHVSGMKFTYDSTKAAGSRVVTMEVKNAEGTYTAIDLAKEYVIATNAFTAKGGDGFDMFAKAYNEGRVTDLGASDWENLKDYVAKLKTVDPQIEGRIVDVAKK
jgi:5'-nucleotidase / UDP-sugar diphosphatase